MTDVIMVTATVVMAIFSGLSWDVSRQIKRDGAARDSEVNNLLVKLTASILTAGKTAGDPPRATKLFIEQEKSLRESIEEAKKPLPPQGG